MKFDSLMIAKPFGRRTLAIPVGWTGRASARGGAVVLEAEHFASARVLESGGF